MYVKNGKEYTLWQLRLDNPYTAFPAEPSAEILAEYGVEIYDVVKEQPTAEFHQKVGNNLTVFDDVNKKVIYTYEIVDLTAQELFNKKLAQINQEYEDAIEALTAGVPNSEKQTWTKQEAEARAYIADNTAPTPFIDGIVANRGVPKDYLIGKIIEKANAYTFAVAQLTGQRQAKEDAL